MFSDGKGTRNVSMLGRSHERYLLQSVQTIVQLPLAVESQQPDLLPPGAELVESWVSPGDLHGCLLLLLLFA